MLLSTYKITVKNSYLQIKRKGVKMNEEKKHVGRPTNEEVKKIKAKKILKDILCIIIGIGILVFLTTGLKLIVFILYLELFWYLFGLLKGGYNYE